MELILEKLAIYGSALLLCLVVIILYLRGQRKASRRVEEKIVKAQQLGLYEPLSLHPVVDEGKCIKTGACIAACPEKDILGIRNGKATTINASQCVGHGACFHACPTHAITLVIGTEQRGVQLPHVNENFQTNIHGIYIAGELGGMGLIRNAVEQGRQAVEHISRDLKKDRNAEFDLAIIGAGPAGISAALSAKKHNLTFTVLEQDTLGGAVFTFPRSKVVMTSTMNLPLHGKVKLFETSKSELLRLWSDVLDKNGIRIRENCKVENVVHEGGRFRVVNRQGEEITASSVLLAIGRRGTPRKLGIPGENLEKVAYRLLEPEEIRDRNILVVGGGDSAVESAMLLAGQNKVILCYRGETFSRLKPRNHELIREAMDDSRIDVRFSTNPLRIEEGTVTLAGPEGGAGLTIANDLVYIFAGGELPTQFLQKIGIEITTKFGEVVLKH